MAAAWVFSAMNRMRTTSRTTAATTDVHAALVRVGEIVPGSARSGDPVMSRPAVGPEAEALLPSSVSMEEKYPIGRR